MKHTILSTANNILIADIFDDNDNLILGNLSCNISDAQKNDIDNFIVNNIYQQFEPQPISDKTMIEASPVLIAIEEAKETMKWDLIRYIKENPECFLEEVIDYTEFHYGWENSGLVMKMISEYIKLAEQKGLITLSNNSKEYYFAVLKQIIIASTEEQLQEMLK